MTRIAAHSIEPFILHRWSPRAMNNEAIPREELLRLFEAARWAPSWGNSQPWRFVLTVRDTPAFTKLFDTLDPGNQEWCVRAAALVLVCSTKVSKRPGKPDKPLPTHAFDTGAAWMALALQARAMNLVVHGMGGFDPPKARAVCNVPDDVDIHCVVAIGKPGDPALLSEKNRASEKENDRDPLEQHVVDGTF
jgi:nitroreductase